MDLMTELKKFPRSYLLPLISLVLFFDLVLSVAIISKVKYTEIDWSAYMQEVSGYLSGERNYNNLSGDTGPLVYPAGFLYVFSVIKWLTNSGQDILTG